MLKQNNTSCEINFVQFSAPLILTSSLFELVHMCVLNCVAVLVHTCDCDIKGTFPL